MQIYLNKGYTASTNSMVQENVITIKTRSAKLYRV